MKVRLNQTREAPNPLRKIIAVQLLDGVSGWVEVPENAIHHEAVGTVTLFQSGERWFHYHELIPGTDDVVAEELTPTDALRWVIRYGLPIPEGLKELAEQTRIR